MNIVLMKLQPTWQGIPIEVKENIVEYLDYKSRCCLRVCSNSDKDLIDSRPVSVRSVSLDLSSNELEIESGGESVEIHDNIVDHFCKIFKHTDSIVRSLSLNWYSPDDAATDAVDFVAKTEALSMIKVKSFNLGSYESQDRDFFHVVNIFHPEHLKRVDLYRLSQKQVEYLMKSDCWKNVKLASFNECEDVKIDDVLHLYRIKASVNNLTADDAWKLIDSFRQKEGLKRSIHWFGINYSRGSTEEQIVSEFKVAPKRVENTKHEKDPTKPKYCYHFQTNTNGMVLIVEITKSIFSRGIVGKGRELLGYIKADRK